MGEIRVRVKITNAGDEFKCREGLLTPDQVRSRHVDALVDTGAVRTVIPVEVQEALGIQIRGHRVVERADGRKESVGVTSPILVEVLNRDTIEDAAVLGDEVLIGQTVLNKLDLRADRSNRRLIPNPAHPDQAVTKIKRARIRAGGGIGRLLTVCWMAAYGALAAFAQDKSPGAPGGAAVPKEEKRMETITLGAGCFWCVEAVLQRIKGIESVKSGYAGGKTKNPTYEQICTGATGHAEVVQAVYDPAVVSTEKVIELFFELHDPTTLNRQGADVGTQYRSAIFYGTDEQKKTAEAVKARLDASGRFKDRIVTEITKLDAFYPGEDYHQNYYNQNSGQGYCRVVITPKLKKLGLETK